MSLIYLPAITALNNGSNALPTLMDQGDGVHTSPYGRGNNMGQPGSTSRLAGQGFRVDLDGSVSGWSPYTIPSPSMPVVGVVAAWAADAAVKTLSAAHGWGTVTDWVDSISGLHMTPVNSPLWYPNYMNGHAACVCNDSMMYFANTTLVRAQPFQIRLVWAQLATGLYILGDSASPVAMGGEYGPAPDVGIYAGSGPTCLNGALPIGAVGHTKVFFSGAASSVTQAGVTVLGDAGTNGLVGGLSLSALGAGTGISQNAFLECIVINTAAVGWNAGTDAAMTNYLVTKYNLPAGW